MEASRIDSLRFEIDLIDKDIVRLLEYRFSLVRKIGTLKKEQGLLLKDTSREEVVLNNLYTYLEDKDLFPFIKRIYSEILHQSLLFQQNAIKRKDNP